jgi:hypothetical protein
MHILAVLQRFQRSTNSHVFDDTSIWMKAMLRLVVIFYVGFYLPTGSCPEAHLYFSLLNTPLQERQRKRPETERRGG